MIAQAWHPLCSLAPYTKGASMARKDVGETSQKSSRDEPMDQDDRVRGRADEMEDASPEDESDDTDDLDDEDAEEGEGSF
jgi:phage shock protein A